MSLKYGFRKYLRTFQSSERCVLYRCGMSSIVLFRLGIFFVVFY